MAPRDETPRLAAALAAAATGLALLAAGCASTSERADAVDQVATTNETGPRSGADDSEIARILERNAIEIPDLLDGMIESPPRDDDLAPQPPPTRAARQQDQQPLGPNPLEGVDPASPGFARDLPADGQTEPFDADLTPTPPPETPERRTRRLVADLAATLRARAEIAPNPLSIFLPMAALEAFEPNLMQDPRDSALLTPRETTTLEVFRTIQNAARGAAQSNSPVGRLEAAITDGAERLQQWNTLRITTAELCSRVHGYGVYDPMPGPRFLAGREHRAIVYVELDDFASRRGSLPGGGAGYITELAQTISLFHDADGLLVWKQDEQNVTDHCRNRRQDFYLVQLIELPESLTVGAYRLKVTIRDRATDAVAEAILPIEIVADAALVRTQAGRNE